MKRSGVVKEEESRQEYKQLWDMVVNEKDEVLCKWSEDVHKGCVTG